MPRRKKTPAPPAVAQRRNITQPADWWHAFESAAEAAATSLSEWIGDACRAALAPDAAEQLSRRRTRGKEKTAEK